MCTVIIVNPNTLLLLLAAFALTVSVFFEGKLTSEALPIMRQERSVDEGPLHGSDFLSVFIDSSFPENTPKIVTEETTTSIQASTEYRVPRSTLHLTSYTDTSRRRQPTIGNLFKINRGGKISSDNPMSDGVVVAVRVSASVGKTLINKNGQQINLEQGKNDIEDSTTSREQTQWTSTEKSEYKDNDKEFYVTPLEDDMAELHPSSIEADKNHIENIADQIPVASEDHPSVIAESSKDEFNIEEKEPITTNSDLGPAQSAYVSNYQPNVPSTLPDFNPPSDLIQHGQTQTKVHPYQQTVIFHNTGGDHQARSVSYSTVAQGVSSLDDRNWGGEKIRNHERQERHYDGRKTSDFINNLGGDTKGRYNGTNYNHELAQTYPVTETPNIAWDKIATSTTPKFSERNWEFPEKPYTSRPSPRPRFPAQAEQNYEVDESVSVVTNGRVHGVQPKQNDSKNKKEDNQKVGYVVEGRNYRKYRVEERTSDGFIVGEYGVVSHDDGSLRGVRYTADGTINPRLIYDALMKFLSL